MPDPKNYGAIRAIVTEMLKTGWGNRTAVRWPNTAFKQPKDADWIVLTVQFGRGGQQSIGATPKNIERVPGLVIIQIFTKKDGGVADAEGHVDKIRDIFQAKQTIKYGANCTFLTCQLPAVGERADFLQTNVNIPFDGDLTF